MRVVLTMLAAAALGTAADARPRGTATSPPDLTGYWSLASWTQLQRPRKPKSLVLTPAEARAWEAEMARTDGVLLAGPDDLGEVESEFNETGVGLARIRGQFRSSWIVSTPDGRFPYTAEARKRLREAPKRFDNPEDRSRSAASPPTAARRRSCPRRTATWCRSSRPAPTSPWWARRTTTGG